MNVVRNLMTSDPIMIAPDATLQEAAQKMKAVDCGKPAGWATGATAGLA